MDNRSERNSALLGAIKRVGTSYGEDWPEGSPMPNFWVQVPDGVGVGTSTGVNFTKTYVEDALREKIERDVLLREGSVKVRIAGRNPNPYVRKVH
jgi:hypothetical protein